MAKRTCSVDGCDRPYFGKSFCGPHYQRWTKWGDPQADKPIRNRALTRGTCVIEGCERPHQAGGWCEAHYHRWKKTGDPQSEVPVAGRVSTEGLCRVKLCERPIEARGLCAAHLRREDKYGDPQATTPIKVFRTDCSVPGCELPHAGLGWCDFHYQPYRLYKVTPERYAAILARQGGGCAICGRKPEPGKRLHVDHDHACCPAKKRSCGKCVRGLLCSACNTMLGHANDDPDVLRRGIDYLERAHTAPHPRRAGKRTKAPIQKQGPVNLATLEQRTLWDDEVA